MPWKLIFDWAREYSGKPSGSLGGASSASPAHYGKHGKLFILTGDVRRQKEYSGKAESGSHQVEQAEVVRQLLQMPPGCLPRVVFWTCPTKQGSWARPGTHWRDYVSRLAWELPGGARRCGWGRGRSGPLYLTFCSHDLNLKKQKWTDGQWSWGHWTCSQQDPSSKGHLHDGDLLGLHHIYQQKVTEQVIFSPGFRSQLMDKFSNSK